MSLNEPDLEPEDLFLRVCDTTIYIGCGLMVAVWLAGILVGALAAYAVLV